MSGYFQSNSHCFDTKFIQEKKTESLANPEFSSRQSMRQICFLCFHRFPDVNCVFLLHSISSSYRLRLVWTEYTSSGNYGKPLRPIYASCTSTHEACFVHLCPSRCLDFMHNLVLSLQAEGWADTHTQFPMARTVAIGNCRSL